MSLVFATTFFFFCFFLIGGGGGYFVTRLSRPILSSKFLDPWYIDSPMTQPILDSLPFYFQKGVDLTKQLSDFIHRNKELKIKMLMYEVSCLDKLH